MLKVFWRSQEMESFTLKCRNEEQLKLWQTTLERYLEKLKDRKRKKQSIGPLAHSSPNFDDDDSTSRGRPPRPTPPNVEIKESPQYVNKSYFDTIEDKNEVESIKTQEFGKRRTSLSFAAQMPTPIPSYKPPPPYEHPHMYSNEGLSKEEKKSNSRAPPRPTPPPQLQLGDNVQPFGSLDRPKSSATPSRVKSVMDDESDSYQSPRRAPAPPQEKFRGRSTTEAALTKTAAPKLQIQPIKVKISTFQDKYAMIITERTLTFIEFYTRIQAKIHSTRFKIKYNEEDRDKFIKTDEDVYLALQNSEKRDDKTLNIVIINDS